MSKNSIMACVCVFVAGVSFFCGVKYNQFIEAAAREARFTQMGAGGFATFPGIDGAGGRGAGVRGNRMAGNATFGEILSKDDAGITVKLREGGSRIIVLSSSTQIMKTTEGSTADLVVGAQVTALGSVNSDGSVTAQSIQVRLGTELLN